MYRGKRGRRDYYCMYEGCQLQIITSDRGRPKEYCYNHLNIRKQEAALAYYYRHHESILVYRAKQRLVQRIKNFK